MRNILPYISDIILVSVFTNFLQNQSDYSSFRYIFASNFVAPTKSISMERKPVNLTVKMVLREIQMHKLFGIEINCNVILAFSKLEFSGEV